MRIALAAANMAKPVVSWDQLVARLSAMALQCQDCNVLVLPEYWAMLGLCFAPDGMKESEEIPWLTEELRSFRMADKVSDIAERYDIAILSGSWPVETQIGYVNRAFFIDADGVHHVQDKMALTDEETDRMGWYLKPGEQLDIFNFMGAKCAIAICHDTSSAKEFEELKKAGVELVFMPSMCEFEGNDKSVDGHKWIFNHAKLRSAEMNCFFACVGSVGMQSIGGSLEENVGGAALYQSGVCLAEIGPMSKGRGATAHYLKVDIDI